MTTQILTASIVVALALVSSKASAGADCQYRITGSDQITVTPSGFTGKMSCNKKQTEELVAALAKGLAEAKLTDAVIKIGDLSSFWFVREGMAKSLAASTEWDSAAGTKKAGTQGVVTTEIIPMFDPMFNKHGLRVASANIEDVSVEDASKQGFKGIKGKFPYTGKISLTVTKSSN